jgi:hypothetical protein
MTKKYNGEFDRDFGKKIPEISKFYINLALVGAIFALLLSDATIRSTALIFFGF